MIEVLERLTVRRANLIIVKGIDSESPGDFILDGEKLKYISSKISDQTKLSTLSLPSQLKGIKRIQIGKEEVSAFILDDIILYTKPLKTTSGNVYSYQHFQ